MLSPLPVSAPSPFLFAAALIAGGQSKRMGMDKAFLDWQGQPLWETQLAKLAALQPSRLLISCRREQTIIAPQAEFVFDPPGSDGPLPALARCLESGNLPVLALAVDMPHVSADFLRELMAMSVSEDRGVIYHGPHGYEPLCALYPIGILPLLQEAIAAGNFRFQSLVQKAVDAGWLTVVPITEENLFFNLNTPADLATP
jgi:molybdenum cofactor guanylyltransferase